MADKTAKVPENVPGAWYVDNTCTPCRVCLDVALVPTLMKYKGDDESNYVHFYKQPASPEELAAAEEAASVCPQSAIGNDGA